MARFDFRTFGRPPEKHHHRLRMIASLVAAISGGGAVLVAFMIVVGTVAPSDSPLLWILGVVLLLVCLTGLWWRWDSPDARDPHRERERRGY